MKALVLHGQNNISYDEIDIPEIKDDEVLVKVIAAGICGSDIPRVLGTAAHYYPIVLGHEFSGDIVKIGDKVKNVSAGDRVAGAPLVPCGRCIDCSRGHYSQCKNYTFIGSRESGAWAEYVKIPGKNVVKLLDGVSYEQGVFFEPTTVVLHGLFTMDFKSGYDVAVLGMGTIGLLAIQCAKALGARRIFAFDIVDEKLKVAEKYGADVCLNTGDPMFKDAVMEETDGRGFEIVIEAAGSEYTEKLSLEIASNKGNILFIGTPSKNITLTPKEFEHINRKELTIKGSWMSYSPPFPGREWELAGYYINSGKVLCDRLIDRVIPMKNANEAFLDIAAPGKVKGKVIMKP